MTQTKPVTATCADKVRPALGVKRFVLSDLLSSNACGIHHSEPHRLKFNVAVLITAGADEHTVDFSAIQVKPNDLLLLRSGQVHSFAERCSLKGEILTFTPEFLGTLAHLPGLAETVDILFGAGPLVSLSAQSAGHTGKWFAEFSEDLAQRGKRFSESRIAFSFALLVNRIAGLPEFSPAMEENSGSRPTVVRDFKPLLEKSFLQQREPAWYAAQLHVSTRTLDRQLVKAVRKTCKELLTDRLLLEAKRLLSDPALQVKNVAHTLCFDEVANFSRFFHSNAGLRPRDFRSHPPDWPH